MTERETAIKNLARQVQEASYVGLHKGNYGLRYYVSEDQKGLIHEALMALASGEDVRDKEGKL